MRKILFTSLLIVISIITIAQPKKIFKDIEIIESGSLTVGSNAYFNGDSTIFKNPLILGVQPNSRIIVNNPLNKPELRFESNKWQYSNDGVTFKDFADGSNYVDLTNSQTIAGEKTFTGYTTIQTDQSGALRLKNTTDFGTNLSFFYDNSDTANEFSAVTLHAGVSSRVDGNERSSFDITVKRDGVNESYAFFSDGQFRSTRLWLVAAQGTAPLRIESTTLNVNLNADLLDDQEGSYYLNLVNSTGILADANLSSNVALKDIDNNFSANQTIDANLNVTGSVTADNVFEITPQLLSGTAVNFDCSTSINGSITLTAATTINFTNLSDGMSGLLLVKQDATGGHNLTITPSYLKATDTNEGIFANFVTSPSAVNLIKWHYIAGEFLIECLFPFTSETL